MIELLNIRITIIMVAVYIILDSYNIIIRIKDYDKKGVLSIYPHETILFQYKFINNNILNFFLNFKIFKSIIFLRIIVALIILLIKSLSFLIIFIFFIQLFLHLRNDSLFSLADRFILSILLGLSIYYYFDTSIYIQNLSLSFIAFLTIISYFFTSFYKLKSELWRKGLAIEQILSTDLYGNEKYYTFLINHKLISRFLNYSTIVFQLSAPLTLFSSKFAIVFFIVGIVFHLSIAIIMNLNNFFWVFVSTYPCIYFVSLKLEKFLWK